MVRKYHNHKLQPNPWHREEEPHNNHEALGKQTKQSNQISLPNLSLSSPLFYSPTSLLSTRSPIYSLLSLSLCLSLLSILCRSLLSILFVSLYSVSLSLYVSFYSVSLSTSVSTLSLSLSLLCLSTLSLSLYFILYTHSSLLSLYLILYSHSSLLSFSLHAFLLYSHSFSILSFATRTPSLLALLLYSLFLYSHYSHSFSTHFLYSYSFSTRTPSLLTLLLYSLLL